MQSCAWKDQAHSIVFKLMKDGVRVLSLQPPHLGYPQKNEAITGSSSKSLRVCFLTTNRSIVLFKDLQRHFFSPWDGQDYRVTFVVLTLLPVLQLHPVRSGRTLHSSPSIQGCIWHHHFWATMEASTQEGMAWVVPATWPGKQEHLTVWDLSSILFLLQQRWAAITSHVPAFTCTVWLLCACVREARQRDSSRLHTPTPQMQGPRSRILLVRCSLVPLAQQVILSPHSRSAIRDGGEARIPSPVPYNGSSLTGRLCSTGAEKLHHTLQK